MAAATPSADFVAALREYQPLLRRVARLYCQDADDRQDLFQEMVLQLWRAWPRYVPQPGAKLSTWLYRIALNVAISNLRQRTRRPAPSELTPKPWLWRKPPKPATMLKTTPSSIGLSVGCPMSTRLLCCSTSKTDPMRR